MTPSETDDGWTEAPVENYITLQDGAEIELCFAEPEFQEVETQWGRKYQILVNLPEDGMFQTGSKWLVNELTEWAADKHPGQITQLEGLQVMVRRRGMKLAWKALEVLA